MSDSKLTIVIVTIDRPLAVIRLVRSIRRRYPTISILIGEQIKDGDASALKGIDATVLALPYDYGLGSTRNALASRVLTDYFVLCDDDFIFAEQTNLTPAIDILERNDAIGVVGGLLFDVAEEDTLHERSPRHWEKWIHLDRERKTLLLMPIAYELPEYSYVQSWRYLHADTVLNWAVMRTSLFHNGVLGWGDQFKTTGEHEDFFLQAKVTAPQVDIVYCPDLIAYHHSAISHGSDYRDLRSRLDGWTQFRRKWNIDRVIDIAEVDGNSIDTDKLIVHSASSTYKDFKKMAKRDGKLKLGQNSVGFDDSGRMYCDQHNGKSPSRIDEGELFICQTTGKLRMTLSAEFATRLRAIRENDYVKERSIWARLFFRTSGRPIQPLRRILFHNNGKPRGVFRKYVLRAAAKPGTALHHWMTRPAYLALPRAVRPSIWDQE